MAYYPDLATECQIARGPHVRAVGWLAAGQEYPTTDQPDPTLVERLAAFREHWGGSIAALSWPVAGGFHRCEFCDGAADGANFGVPDGEILYCCPGMIAHYVDAHRYAPPAEFVQAVQRCPLPGTVAYAHAAVRFHRLVGEKDAPVRDLYAELLGRLEQRSFFALPDQATPSDAIVIGEGFKRPDHQRRLLLKCDNGTIRATFGHGQFHEWHELEVDEEHLDLSPDEVVALVDERFRRSPSRGRKR